MSPRFPFVAVDAPAGRADELGYVLMDLGASGVELRPQPEGVQLRASFDTHELAGLARKRLLEAEPGLVVELGEIIGDEWRDAYKEHFKPFALTPTIWVVPSWEQHQPRQDEQVLHMDPGRAFGTGLHATTSLVAEALEGLGEGLRGRRVLDVGTGSGVLIITALLLGAASGVAIDNDASVLDVARDNAQRNDVADRVSIHGADIAVVEGCFDVVLANIRAGVLIAMAAELVARTGSVLVLSGVLAGEEAEVCRAFVEHGMRHEATTRRGEGDDAWVALTLRPS